MDEKALNSDKRITDADQSLQASTSRVTGWTFSVFPPSVSGATGAGLSFLRAFLTDAAWRGSAASLRISATIFASAECVRRCVGMSP